MNIDKILHHYAICALWSSLDEDDQPFDLFYTIDDIDSETLKNMREDIMDFIKGNEKLLIASNLSDEQIGHNFWLTRNRHGAGFWDCGLGEIGQKLTSACHPYGDVYLYISDDGRVCQ